MKTSANNKFYDCQLHTNPLEGNHQESSLARISKADYRKKVAGLTYDLQPLEHFLQQRLGISCYYSIDNRDIFFDKVGIVVPPSPFLSLITPFRQAIT